MTGLSQQNCRDCGLPFGEHRVWCAQAPDEPEPYDPIPDASDYGWAEDRLIEQLTGEPRGPRS